MGAYVCPAPVGQFAVYRVKNPCFGLQSGKLIAVFVDRPAIAKELVLVDVGGEWKIARFFEDYVEFPDGSTEAFVYSVIGVIDIVQAIQDDS
jgi:hypothetical protein